MKEKIIQAIKNFDLESLKELLDDKKSYQDVPKQLFLEKLEMTFNRAKLNECYLFDDVFFGICGSCNKGCEGMTFLSNTGYYLDLFIESDEQIIKDMYVCNKLTNFTELNKTDDLGFSFYKDDEVLFKPSSSYVFIKEQFNLLESELKNVEGAISIAELSVLYNSYNSLTNEMAKTHPLSPAFYTLYGNVNQLTSSIEEIFWLKLFKNDAVNGLIDYQLAQTEREQLIWFYQNQKNHKAIEYGSFPENWCSDSIVIYKVGTFDLSVDISGYEFVLDYLEKLQQFYDDILEKYRPTSEHFKQSKTKGIEYSLESHLRLHEKHLDVIRKYIGNSI